MKKFKIFILFFLLIFALSFKNDKLYEKALKIHKKAIVIDGHCDVPMLLSQNIDLSKKRKEKDIL